MSSSRVHAQRGLFASLFDLYLSGTNCDLVLLTSDDVRFQVHSIVIAATFPTIRQEIECQKAAGLLSCLQVHKGRRKGMVALKKVRASELRLLVRFAYLDDCQLSDVASEDLVNLLRAAIELRVHDLARQIGERFRQRLTPSAALELFRQGRRDEFEEAFDLAEEYLLRHLIHFEPSDLQDFKVEDLEIVLRDDRLHVESEEDVWRTVEAWVAADATNRAQLQEQLVKCLRIGLVSEEFLKKLLENAGVNKTLKNSIDNLREWKENGKKGVPFEVRARIPHKVLVVFGGMAQEEEDGCDPVKQFELYNVNSNTWTKSDDLKMSWPRGFFASAAMGSEIFIFGGYGGESNLTSCQKVNIFTNKWTDLPQMMIERYYACAASARGEIFVLGGQYKRPQDKARSVEKFNPDTGAWSQVPDLTSARCDAALVDLNGWIHVLGGFDGVIVLSSVEKLDPEARAWTFGPRMVRQRSGLGAVAFEGRIFAFGGHDGFQHVADGEVFNPEIGAWSLLAPMNTCRSNFGIAQLGRLFYVVGGFGGPTPGRPLAQVEAYNPDLDKWFEIECMSGPRSGLAACVIESLPFSLKVWDKVEGLEGCYKAQTCKDDAEATNKEIGGSLEPPLLEPLPPEWLQAYQDRHPPTGTSNPFSVMVPD